MKDRDKREKTESDRENWRSGAREPEGRSDGRQRERRSETQGGGNRARG